MDMERLTKCGLCCSGDIFELDKTNALFKCQTCGYIFDNPRPIFAEIRDFYSRHDKYDAWLTNEQNRMTTWRRHWIIVERYKKSGTLLDIGAGIGQFLSMAGKGFDVTGTEISETALRIARKKYGLCLISGRIDDIDFGSRKFDIITLFHVLEHVPDPALMLETCRGLLSKTGILIIAVPNEAASLIRPPLKRVLSFLRIGRFRNCGKFGVQRIAVDGSLNEIHLSHFTVSSLRKALTRKGYCIVDDTLSPYYFSYGARRLINDFVYYGCLAIHKIFGVNIYDNILVVAKPAEN